MPNWIYHIVGDAFLWGLLYLLGANPGFSALSLFILSNVIDADHLLSRPIYNPKRNSIGFHLFHKKILIPFYIAGCFIPGITKYLFIGILLHMILDWAEFEIKTRKIKAQQ